MDNWMIVEKKNHLAVHGLFDSKERAEKFLKETIPVHCARGYHMDKTLTPTDFVIVNKETHND